MGLALLFGWPAVLASILVSAVGIAIRRAVIVLIGTLLAAPFVIYLTGTPRFAYAAPVAGLIYLTSVYAVARLKRWIAWGLWFVFLAFVGWIGLALAAA